MGLYNAWGGRGLVGRLGVKKSLGKHGHIWEGSISMDL